MRPTRSASPATAVPVPVPAVLRRAGLVLALALPACLALHEPPARAATASAEAPSAALADAFFHDVEIDYAGGVADRLKHGFDPNTKTAKGQPALSQALVGQSMKVARVLWEAPGIAIDARNNADETPLMLAALKAEADACAALLARGAAVDKAGWSPLHYAATGGNAGIVRMLLAKGAAIEARSPNGTTPLMMAAMYGSEEAVDALLSAGADRSATNQQGLNAAAFATKAGRDKLAARIAPEAR